MCVQVAWLRALTLCGLQERMVMDGSGVQELAAVQQALEWFDHDVDGTFLLLPAASLLH